MYSNSALYEGLWSEGRRAGRGKMIYENGDVYEGEWMRDEHHGLGIIRYGEKTFLYHDPILELIRIQWRKQTFDFKCVSGGSEWKLVRGRLERREEARKWNGFLPGQGPAL